MIAHICHFERFEFFGLFSWKIKRNSILKYVPVHSYKIENWSNEFQTNQKTLMVHIKFFVAPDDSADKLYEFIVLREGCGLGIKSVVGFAFLFNSDIFLTLQRRLR